MRIVIAPDSFKESLPAEAVAHSIAMGLKSVWTDAECIEIPMADGGEGTVNTFISSMNGELVDCNAHDPLMRPIQTQYGLINNGNTAVIEVAAASGLPLLLPAERDATIATSFGTGEIILHALESGIRDFIIGIGGSATNDGGTGVAQALGYHFLDRDENELEYGGIWLEQLIKIDGSNAHPALNQSTFHVACDVNIPLCGPTGSTLNYGQQKGINARYIPLLEQSMVIYGVVLDAFMNRSISVLPGAGAAGGIGAGLVAFTSATLEPGFDLVSRACGLEEKINACDLVITGEGKIDAQTAQGKVPSGVARIAAQYGKPVIGFCGTLDSQVESTRFEEIIAIDVLASDTHDAITNVAQYLTQAATSFARRWT